MPANIPTCGNEFSLAPLAEYVMEGEQKRLARLSMI